LLRSGGRGGEAVTRTVSLSPFRRSRRVSEEACGRPPAQRRRGEFVPQLTHPPAASCRARRGAPAQLVRNPPFFLARSTERGYNNVREGRNLPYRLHTLSRWCRHEEHSHAAGQTVETSTRLHADRAAGSHCHHCHPHRPALACSPEGPRG